MTQGIFSGDWGHYLSCLPLETYNHTQLLDQCSQLDLHSYQIFSDHDTVEVWRTDCSGKPSMSRFDAQNIDTSGDVAYIIHQNHSWSPLNTSLDAIRKLMTAYKISPILLDAIRAFGSKVTGDDDPYFNFCSFKTDTGGGNGDYELCYLLRTYERHGRKSLKDPWSLRQMAVYERFNAAEGRSVWILIQPFASAKSEFLRQCFRPQVSQTMGAKLHGVFIGTALANWRWYLNDQRRLVNVHNEKAVFSQATPKAVDYDTGFSDCQKLHQLAWNLSLGEEILASYSHIVQMLQSNLMTTKDEMLDTIRQIHRLARSAAALRQNSERTSKLLLRLLEYRRSEVSNAQTATLAVLLQQANSQNLQLNDLIQKSRVETRSTTFLTYIATFYLPATLIASIFSSDMIQIPRKISDQDHRVLLVSDALWVFTLSSLLLTAVTASVIVWWRRLSR